MIRISESADKWCYRGQLYFNGELQPARDFSERVIDALAKLKGYDFIESGVVMVQGETGLGYPDKEYFIKRLEDRFELYRFETELEKLQYKSRYCND